MNASEDEWSLKRNFLATQVVYPLGRHGGGFYVENKIKKFEVVSSGQVVWVNSADTGICLGRFGPNGVDIHFDFGHAMRTECYDCTHSPATLDDWRRFVRVMKSYHNVEVPESHQPRWLKG